MLESFLAAIISDDEKAEAAARDFSLLSKAQQDEAIRALKPLREDPQNEIRWWAVRGLSAIHSDKIPPLLIEMLTDPNAAVRQAAALGLRLQPSPEAIPHLLNALEDPDQLTAQLAAQALSACGREAVEQLISMLKDCSPTARHLIIRALAEIGDERAIEPFYRLLEDDSLLVQHWANKGLDRLGAGLVLFKP